MRVLRFLVRGQVISKDPDCDFDGLVPGSDGYLKAEFRFSPDWDGYKKVIGFSNVFHTAEFQPQVLEDGLSCIIPAEALKRKRFVLWVVGKNATEKKTTNDILIRQNGGN